MNEVRNSGGHYILKAETGYFPLQARLAVPPAPAVAPGGAPPLPASLTAILAAWAPTDFPLQARPAVPPATAVPPAPAVAPTVANDESTNIAFEASEEGFSWAVVSDEVRTEPPRAAELLVSWCIKKRYRKALLDDLDEVFQRDLTKGMTVARAHLRYWGAALHSITPQLLAAAKRIGLFGLIADYARRLLH